VPIVDRIKITAFQSLVITFLLASSVAGAEDIVDRYARESKDYRATAILAGKQRLESLDRNRRMSRAQKRREVSAIEKQLAAIENPLIPNFAPINLSAAKKGRLATSIGCRSGFFR